MKSRTIRKMIGTMLGVAIAAYIGIARIPPSSIAFEAPKRGGLEQKIEHTYKQQELIPSNVKTEYETQLESLKDSKGEGIFQDWEINALEKVGVDVEYVKKLSSKYNALEIIILDQAKVSLEGIEAFLHVMESIKDKKGQSLNKYEINDLVFTKIREGLSLSAESVKDLAQVEDENGNKAFEKKEILELARADVPAFYAKSMICEKDKKGNQKYTIFEIKRLYQLGFSKENLPDFKDTDKPNAIIVYPTSDEFDSFERKESINFFKKIQSKYDINLVITPTEDRVYEAIDSTPDVKLLILNGHGSPEDLFLGGNNLTIGEMEMPEFEEYRLDKSDKELQKYLNKLSSDAVIFICSCSTAEGGSDKDNFANFIIKNSGGRKVIASKDKFSAKDIEVLSLYPFNLRITLKESGKDLTYTNK